MADRNYLRRLDRRPRAQAPPGTRSREAPRRGARNRTKARMNIEWVRNYCLSLPHVTESVQWGADLVFKIGGKMFAVVPLEPAKVWLSCKSSPEEFAQLIERP